MLDCKSMQVKTWFAREKRSTEAFTRGRASSERAIWARTGLVVDPATRCTALGVSVNTLWARVAQPYIQRREWSENYREQKPSMMISAKFGNFDVQQSDHIPISSHFWSNGPKKANSHSLMPCPKWNIPSHGEHAASRSRGLAASTITPPHPGTPRAGQLSSPIPGQPNAAHHSKDCPSSELAPMCPESPPPLPRWWLRTPQPPLSPPPPTLLPRPSRQPPLQLAAPAWV